FIMSQHTDVSGFYMANKTAIANCDKDQAIDALSLQLAIHQSFNHRKQLIPEFTEYNNEVIISVKGDKQ
ncbi:MAG: hypothetical protein K8R21_03685, partial [Leptospira sp.]|nr:hypothetical protein [Leptospira sp.]